MTTILSIPASDDAPYNAILECECGQKTRVGSFSGVGSTDEDRARLPVRTADIPPGAPVDLYSADHLCACRRMHRVSWLQAEVSMGRYQFNEMELATIDTRTKKSP